MGRPGRARQRAPALEGVASTARGRITSHLQEAATRELCAIASINKASLDRRSWSVGPDVGANEKLAIELRRSPSPVRSIFPSTGDTGSAASLVYQRASASSVDEQGLQPLRPSGVVCRRREIRRFLWSQVKPASRARVRQGPCASRQKTGVRVQEASNKRPTTQAVRAPLRTVCRSKVQVIKIDGQAATCTCTCTCVYAWALVWPIKTRRPLLPRRRHDVLLGSATQITATALTVPATILRPGDNLD
jgi:hypothetical protein